MTQLVSPTKQWHVRALRWIGNMPGATSLVEQVHGWNVECNYEQLQKLVKPLQSRGLLIDCEHPGMPWPYQMEATK